MTISEPPNRVNSRWLQGFVLLCALVVLPVGMVSAQDYEAVGKRLKAAVEAGELTGEQARTMLETLKRADVATKDQDQHVTRAKAHLANVKKELTAAVEAGKISEEDAKAKYAGAERAVKEKIAAGQYLMKVKKELAAAVEAGKISREDAAKKLEGAEKAIKEKLAAGRGGGDSKRFTREDLSRAETEIRKAVAAGKLSEEEARAKMHAMRKMLAEQPAGSEEIR